MGLFDSFWSEEQDRCPDGHLLRATGGQTEYQTKALECRMHSYFIGDSVLREDEHMEWRVKDGELWVYDYCPECNRGLGRWAHIVDGKFIGFTGPPQWG